MEEQTATPNELPEEGRVIANGEEYILTITKYAVMFKKDERVWGFDKSAIRRVELKDDKELVVAYSLNGEIRSVAIRPLAIIVSYRWKPEKDEFPGELRHFAAPLRSYMSQQDYERVCNIEVAHDREQKAARKPASSSQPHN